MSDLEPEREELDAQSQRERDLHERALKRFDEIYIAVEPDRAEMLSDRRFVSIAGAQWEGNWGEQFANSIMVEVNKTAAGVEKIEGDYRQNRVTVNFRGVGDDADEDTATLLDGLFRADVYASQGGQAFDNAFSEAITGGFGAWRLLNVWEDELDPENDHQRIAFEVIVDADQCVFFDLNSKKQDKSDAKFAFVVTAMTREAYEEKYNDNPEDWPSAMLQPYYFDWRQPDFVRVAEYYEIEDKTAVQRIFRHRNTEEERREWATDLDEDELAQMDIEGWQEIRTVRRKRRRVMKSVLSGGGVLEKPRRVAGTRLPIVPIYGKRWFIDNLERARGHVRLAKDPQRIYNAQVSKLGELASQAPNERPILTPEQIQGHEEPWAEANINRHPYSLVNPIYNPDGSIAQLGPVGSVSPQTIPPALAALAQLAGADLIELTGANSNTDEVRSNISADAMDIAVTQQDAKFALYKDNLKLAMQCCGEVYAGMAPEVYFEEEREVETVSESGDHETAILVEGVTDPKSGNYRIRNDLSAGRYKVISDVSEATATRRDKTVKALVNVAQMAAAVDPPLARASLYTAVANMDGESIDSLKGWARKVMVSDGVIEPTKEEAEELQAAAENQQPDATQQVLAATAQKESALAQKAVADTALSEAKTQLTTAQAENERQEALAKPEEKRMGMMERIKSFVTPQPKPGAPTRQ